ncbi:porin family protein [Fulvivirga lutea]|uniref:Porin family protein n=1 Tax=Fulvivirga lutea TaxID=2810512 RepID=A0A974WEX8_9BACT|nr:porin family protein [Fulvivirga lutea]QSE96409.1 porin family protein [Fulvivirga lutea]
MKKITILSLFIFGAIFSTNAQVTVGAKAGLNFANVDTEGSTDARTSLHLGGFGVIMFSDNLGFQPELLYSAQGFERDFGAGTFEANINYLNLPLLVRYNINEMISLHAGPQLGFLLSAEDEDGNDFKDDVKGTDLTFAIGGQVDLPVGLVAGARYGLGLSDINDNDLGSETKNRVFQLYVGWKLFGN